MLGQRRRRWPNIKTLLAERLVFAAERGGRYYGVADWDLAILAELTTSPSAN